MQTHDWFYWQGDTLILNLHIQPRAKQDAIVGPHGDALKLRISAPPVDGKANAHLLRFLARQFGVSNQQVSLLSGDNGRHKRVAIQSPARYPEPWLLEAKP